MKAVALWPAEYLHECFRYDEETGALFWRERPLSHFSDGVWTAAKAAKMFNARFAGRPAATTGGGNGYLRCTLDRRSIGVHRIIWVLLNGFEPDLIDHINGDRRDNRRENLRSVSPSLNSRNRGYSAERVRGVHKHKNRWVAVIDVDGVRIRESFALIEDASSWRKRMEREHGFINRDKEVRHEQF